ncbi:hypothetical protein [Antribacter gilvus]|nr:hypothetical protein [Antribacter gilvus]
MASLLAGEVMGALFDELGAGVEGFAEVARNRPGSFGDQHGAQAWPVGC